MLEILRTDDGQIKAVCEYYIVDSKGNFDGKGKYIWIEECEVSQAYRGNGNLKTFIKLITDKHPEFEYGYFWRQRKYPGRPPRIYSKRQWLKLIGGN